MCISVHRIRMVQVKTNGGDGGLIGTKVAVATCGDHWGCLQSGLGGNDSYHQNMVFGKWETGILVVPVSFEKAGYDRRPWL